MKKMIITRQELERALKIKKLIKADSQNFTVRIWWDKIYFVIINNYEYFDSIFEREDFLNLMKDSDDIFSFVTLNYHIEKSSMKLRVLRSCRFDDISESAIRLTRKYQLDEDMIIEAESNVFHFIKNGISVRIRFDIPFVMISANGKMKGQLNMSYIDEDLIEKLANIQREVKQ